MSNVNHKSAKERIAERIKTGQIMGRLQDFFMGLSEKMDCPHCKEEIVPKVKLSAVQARVGIALLGKTLPDLKAVEKTIIEKTKKTKADISNQLLSQGFTEKQVEELWQKAAKQTHH